MTPGESVVNSAATRAASVRIPVLRRTGLCPLQGRRAQDHVYVDALPLSHLQHEHQRLAADPPDEAGPALRFKCAGSGSCSGIDLYRNRVYLVSMWSILWSTRAPPPDKSIRFAIDVTYSRSATEGRIQLYVDKNGDGVFLDVGEVSPVFTAATMAFVAQRSGSPPGPAVGASIPAYLNVGIITTHRCMGLP